MKKTITLPWVIRELKKTEMSLDQCIERLEDLAHEKLSLEATHTWLKGVKNHLEAVEKNHD